LADANSPQKILGLILDTDIEGSTEVDAIQRRWVQLKGQDYCRLQSPRRLSRDRSHRSILCRDRKAKGSLPRIGVWLMPNNKAFGMFEDLLMESLGAERKGLHNERCETSKDGRDCQFITTAIYRKAVIRTYMAWQEPPDVQYLGLAIQEGHFQNIEAACAQFLDWLGRLFAPLTR
jgi:hypothetical protein